MQKEGYIANRYVQSFQIIYIKENILILKVDCKLHNNDFVVLIGTAHKGVSISNLWIFDMRIAYSLLTRPVNLHPLFLFRKPGSVCGPEKNRVPLKKAGCKKLRSLLFKKRRGSLFSSCFE